MPLFVQIAFGCFAIFAIFMIARTLRSGRILSRDVEFNLNEQPIRFALVLVFQLFILAFCVWCAAGYEPAAFFEAVGIPVD